MQPVAHLVGLGPGRGRTALLLLLLTTLSLLVPGATPAVAASKALSLAPGTTSWVTLGATRTSSIASVAVTVPRTLPVTFGLQQRATHSSGYRTTISISADGTVSASLGRMDAGAETTLVPSTGLGIGVYPGDTVRFEAAVVAKSRVWLYLRAWTGAQAKPATWQLAVSDASSKRRTSGRTYLWAESGETARLEYGSVSVKSYTAARGRAVGVAPPEPGGDTFSIAVIPDTQTETNNTANTPFLHRVNWLVSNRNAFDLRYVLHTGDVTNWGWLDPGQFTRADAAMDVIGRAGIPYSLTIGNHDTAAVGWNGHGTTYGGGPYDKNPECVARLGAQACNSRLLLRKTEAFNQTFPVGGVAGLGGVFEAGKVDNNWTTFTANTTRWLVLTLELWPRTAVVDWARSVVAAHPGENVIIQTHDYLTAKRTIERTNGGYGATSPRYLYDTVVSRYANVKLVFSGHTGTFGSRVDTPDGRTVVSYLGNMLSGSGHNPVRVVSVNTRSGDVFSRVYDPLNAKLVQATSNNIAITR
jgi:hypothetical protein